MKIKKPTKKEYEKAVKALLEKAGRRFLSRVIRATPRGERRDINNNPIPGTPRTLHPTPMKDSWRYKVYKYRGEYKIKVFLNNPIQEQKFKYAFGPIQGKRIFAKPGKHFAIPVGGEGETVVVKSYQRKKRGKAPIYKKLRRIELDIQRRAQKNVDLLTDKMLQLTFEEISTNVFRAKV